MEKRSKRSFTLDACTMHVLFPLQMLKKISKDRQRY